ncbi:EAL domain-containing protein [Ahniella affigens]|nr:EAL domain-containing protein [Ahniella affigens]
MLWTAWAGAAASPAPATLATERTYFFERAGRREDLAQNTVNAMLQDRAGFLWIGTQGGLHRYDGYEFLRFQHVPGRADSLPDSFITALAEDSNGRLYVGTNRRGLTYRAADSSSFQPVPERAQAGPGVASIQALSFAPGRGLWIGSAGGLELLEQNGQRKPWLLQNGGGPIPAIADLSLCANGDLLIASNAGLFRVAHGADVASRLAAAEVSFSSVLCTENGTVYAGSRGRVMRLTETQVETIWPAADAPAPPGVEIFDLVEDPMQRVWVAVRGKGLLILSRTGRMISVLRHNPRLPGSLPEDSVRQLMRDRMGLIWVGGDVHGFSRTDPRGAKFSYLFDPTLGDDEVANNNIRALLPEGDAGLWIGTEGAGLKHYDLSSREIRSHTEPLQRVLDGATSLRIFAIRRAPADPLLWIGSNRGLLHYQPESGTAELVSVRGLPATVPVNPDTRSLMFSRDRRLWLGTFDSGLLGFNPDKQQWQQYLNGHDDAHSLWHPMVLALHEDRLGRIWIGTLNGLNVLDPTSGQLLRIGKRGASGDLAGDLVRVIAETSDGAIWVGTHNGLNRTTNFQGENTDFERFTLADGLSNDTIYGIAEDLRGQIWVSTNGGISRIDPNKRIVQNFGLQDGLQALEFNGGAYTTLPDGRIAFGGTQGLNFFSSDANELSHFEPPMAITATQVGDQIAPMFAGGPIKALELLPGQSVLGLSFAAFDYIAPERNQFEYQVHGLDSGPVKLGNRHEITLTNLVPGNYQIEIRGSNHDHVFASQPLRVPVIVHPYWWQSFWFKSALGLLISGFLIAYAVRRRRLLREWESQSEQHRIQSERLSLALWASRDGFWDWDLRNKRMSISGPAEFAGLSGQAEISEEEWARLGVHQDDLGRVQQALVDHVDGRSDHYEAEYRVRVRDGRYVWIMARGRAVARDEHGKVIRVSGTFRDISEARERDRDQRIAREVIASMSEAVCVTDLEHRFASINPAFTRITGYGVDEVPNLTSDVLNSDQHPREFYHELRRNLLKNGHWSGELWQKRKDGEHFLAWLEMSEVRDAAGNRTHWVAVLTDITDRKRAEQELRYLANYDTLTGLPNRTLLAERLAHSLIRARRFGTYVALLFLDLDRFKHVNDSMGHAAGDRLLKAVAARIVTSVRESDTVARLGGDEFTVVLEDLHDPTEAEAVARKLLESFATPLDLDGRQEMIISPSIGISLYPDHGQVPTDLLKHADTAMYYAKERGRNTFQVYNDAMDAKARMRANMANQLHKALERGELSLVFQPKLNLVEQRITGAEALLRWKNPTLGVISPTEFIPVAEETGLIVPIGEWVIQQACQQLLRWTEAGLTLPTMAVNVSALQLFRGELAKRLREILDAMRVPAHRLELELTESMLMANPEQSIATLTQIKALGLRLAIDDFGTGYSSLAYLKRLPIDTLKIDKAFIADLTLDPDDEAITTTVIMMAHAMGLNVIAEGVETNEQMRYLADQNCDEVQGHLISAPMDADRMLQFLLDRVSRGTDLFR